MNPARVFVVASSPLMWAGLRTMLAEAGEDAPVEVVGGGEPETLEEPSGPPEAEVILLAEEELLEEVGFAALAGESRALVLLSDDEDAAFRLKGLPLAGWAVVPPDSPAEDLAAAIRAAARGLVVLPHALSGRLIETSPAEGPLGGEPPEPLSRREREVLDLLSRGLANKQVARQLSISEHTVKFHVSSIFAKLGVNSRAEAVGVGARLGLITL